MSRSTTSGSVVTDLERSKRFYCELLGFTFEREIQPPDEASAQLMSLAPPLGMTACYLVRDGLVLELLHFAARRVRHSRSEARAMNEPGLTHLSLSVDDIDGCARPRSRVRRRGDRVVEHRRRRVHPRSRRPVRRAAADGVPAPARRAGPALNDARRPSLPSRSRTRVATTACRRRCHIAGPAWVRSSCPGSTSDGLPEPVGSNRAGVEKRSSKQRSVSVERNP